MKAFLLFSNKLALIKSSFLFKVSLFVITAIAVILSYFTIRFNIIHLAPFYFIAILTSIDISRFQGSDILDISYFLLHYKNKKKCYWLFILSESINIKTAVVGIYLLLLFIIRPSINYISILFCLLFFINYTVVNGMFLLLSRRFLIFSRLYRIIPNLYSMFFLLFSFSLYRENNSQIKTHPLMQLNLFIQDNNEYIFYVTALTSLIILLMSHHFFVFLSNRAPLQNNSLVKKNRTFSLG